MIQSLQDQILRGESRILEFKVGLPENSARWIKTVVAFANGAGGRLVFGVDDTTRSIEGVDAVTVFKTMDTIANIIADSCYPTINPDITLQTIAGKTVIVVEILSGRQKPFYIKSQGLEKGIYIRTSASTRPADENTVKELLLEGSNKYYDQLPCPGLTVTDKSIRNLCVSLRETAYKNCVSDSEKALIKNVTQNTLLSWGVLAENGDELVGTNAFALLTGNPVLSVKIQCGLFKGKNRSVFLDRREFTGSLQEQVEQAYNYVLAKINLGAEIDKLYRKDIYELPVRSIREIIANAVVHRSYLEPGNIQVALYDDRLEITSPGMLLNGVTIEKMREGYSKIRNRAIASAFKYMNIIEEWGSGIPRIFDEFHSMGFKTPELRDFDGDFRVNFYRKNIGSVEKKGMIVSENLGVYSKTHLKKLPRTTEKTIVTTEKRTGTTEKTTEKIMRLINNNPSITTEELAIKTGITTDGVYWNIKQLKQKNILKRVGGKKGGYWIFLGEAE